MGSIFQGLGKDPIAGFAQMGGTPKSSIFIRRIFHETNHPAIGVHFEGVILGTADFCPGLAGSIPMFQP